MATCFMVPSKRAQRARSRGGAFCLRGFLILGAAGAFALAFFGGETTATAVSEATASGCSSRSAWARSSRRFKIRPAMLTYFPVTVKGDLRATSEERLLRCQLATEHSFSAAPGR